MAPKQNIINPCISYSRDDVLNGTGHNANVLQFVESRGRRVVVCALGKIKGGRSSVEFDGKRKHIISIFIPVGCKLSN